MCGIAGIVDFRKRRVDRSALERMCNMLRHRGPDGQGYYWNCHVALGQRRLSIIDLANGQQPMCNEDRTVWITFNGEIYNFKQLRSQLEQRGHRFATDSDTEIIVHAYEQYGEQCVTKLRGMFAFAIWDENRNTLFLARDRVGKKPLYYTETDGCFIFASELQALVKHPAVQKNLDRTAIDDYLTYGYIPAPKTPFDRIYKLPPAHHLIAKLDDSKSGICDLKIQRYWHLTYTPKLDLDEDQAAERLLELLSESVRLRMISDAPLGTLLSGGLDSSLVVALMSRLSDKPVKTFSIGFDQNDFNELDYARSVAKYYNTEHQEFIVRPKNLEILPELVRHYGEPYADSSALPTYWVARLTRQHVKTVLNGDGADECFAGYDRYLGSILANVYRRIPSLARRALIEPLCSMIPSSLSRRNRLGQAKRFLRAAGRPASECYLQWMSYFTPHQKHSLYSEQFKHQLGSYDSTQWFRNLFNTCQHKNTELLDAVLSVDVESYLPNDLLTKMDIATMANSLEARSPFLDHHVMEFCAQLPSRFKHRGRTSKYLLKKLGKQLLPAENVNRRKMGFGVPLAHWIRNGMRHEIQDALLSSKACTRNFFKPDAVKQLLSAHCQGKGDYSHQLWALYMLELWYQEFLPSSL